MKIAEIAEFYAPSGGGVRTYIDRKFEAASRAGHELHVLAPARRDGFEPRPGGGVFWIKAPALPLDANYHVFWDPAPVHAVLHQLAPHLIEASSPWRGAWIAASWPGEAKRTLFMHADPVASYPQRWFGPVLGADRVDRLFEGFWGYLRRLSQQFDVTVAGSRWLGDRLSARGLHAVQTVPLGIDRTVFSPTRRDLVVRERLLRQCRLPAAARLLVGIGRHHAEKRWPMVIDAVARAGADIPIGLLLIGDGLARTAVERAVGANPHVQLAAPIRDREALAVILASADALIHGGAGETYGMVVAEALASGTPLVAPDSGGCADLADPRVSEVYSATGNGAAAAILRLFERAPETLRAAALEASVSVRSDRQHFNDLFDLYEVLGRDRKRPYSARRSA
jgi:alpha-1,6-mannosyltransferase